ncbi:hypothetical protein DL96DRAFT_1708326 [Flagelloscypha sp. PMI_526]|nr:hypothetical protein DL96DRAFT_1708326 [Flagelloscypha sp. PMI_526]
MSPNNNNNLKSDSMLSLLIPKAFMSKKNPSSKSEKAKPTLDLSSSRNFSKEAKKNGWASQVAVRPSLGGA